MEMGTGKTKVAIDNVCHLYQNNKIKTVIVIAPNSVYRNWMFEINTHSPEQYHVNVHKKDKKFTRQNNLLNYYLFNVEAFSHDKGSQILKSVVEEYGSQSCVILDESTNSLDLETERNIINFLNELKHEITIVMISHNLENLNICNDVYELKDRKLNKIK